MDENNNNNVNRLNTVLGVEEDKSVGSKIKTFAKKIGMIPDEKVLNIKTRADFRKTNKELNEQLGKWRKASKFHQGNPLINYFIGDKHKVKAIKKTFAEMERTAFKSNRKLRGRLSELFGKNYNELNGRFDYGDGEINDKKIGFKNNKQSQIEQENVLNKLYTEREELLKKQEGLSLLPNEETTMNAIMKAQDDLVKLQKEREKIDSNKLTGVKGTKLTKDDADLILTHNKELSKLAGGFYERTNGDERLFKTLEKDINATMKSDQAEFNKLVDELKSLGGKKGAQTKKLNALMSLYAKNPTNEIASAISAQETKLQETQDKINLKSSQKEIASKHLDVDKRRKAQFDYYYTNKDKPQDFAQDKNYKTAEFPSKFDARMLKLTTARKTMDTDISKFSTAKQLKNVDSSIELIMTKIQSLQDSLVNITSDKDLANVNTELEQKNAEINNSEKELSNTRKQAGELLNGFKKLKLESRAINEELKKLNTDIQVDPWKYELQSSDLDKYNDEIQDIKDGVDSINRGWKKSNVFTRLWSRTLINIRSQISDMFNPFTKFRMGFDSWLNRWDNLPWKNTFDVIAYNLATVFEPMFKWLSAAFIKVMQVINVFIERWTGVNLFDKSAWQLEQIKKGVGQLTASFDELHSSNDNPNQFNTIFDTDHNAVSPLDVGLENGLTKFADNAKKVFDNVWGFIKKHPIASAGIALGTWLFGPMLLKTGASLLGKGLKKLFFGSTATDAAEAGGSLLGNIFGKTLYTGMEGKAVTVGKLLGGIALTAGGTALAISNAADAGKNWEDITTAQKAVKVGFIGIGSAAAGLGAVMLGASGPVGWAVAGTVALGSLVVGMAQTQDGIGSVKEQTEQLTEAQNIAKTANDNYLISMNNLANTTATLDQLEQQTGLSGAELAEQVKNGVLEVDKMTAAQIQVYNAYLQNEEALKQNKLAIEAKTEADKQAILKSLELDAANAIASDSYDQLNERVTKAWKEGSISAEEGAEIMSRALANASDDVQDEFRNKIPEAMREGFDPDKYESGFRGLAKSISSWFSGLGESISGWWNNLTDNKGRTFRGFVADLLPGGKTSADFPSYAVGTNYVPNDQLAMIHQGEAIIPKKYNKPYSPQSNNSNLDSTISAMTQEIANLRSLGQQGVPVKGEFRQRGSDLVAVVEKGKNKNGNQMLSNPAYAR